MSTCSSCSISCPSGPCPSGQACQAGYCVPSWDESTFRYNIFYPIVSGKLNSSQMEYKNNDITVIPQNGSCTSCSYKGDCYPTLSRCNINLPNKCTDPNKPILMNYRSPNNCALSSAGSCDCPYIDPDGHPTMIPIDETLCSQVGLDICGTFNSQLTCSVGTSSGQCVDPSGCNWKKSLYGITTCTPETCWQVNDPTATSTGTWGIYSASPKEATTALKGYVFCEYIYPDYSTYTPIQNSTFARWVQGFFKVTNPGMPPQGEGKLADDLQNYIRDANTIFALSFDFYNQLYNLGPYSNIEIDNPFHEVKFLDTPGDFVSHRNNLISDLGRQLGDIFPNTPLPPGENFTNALQTVLKLPEPSYDSNLDEATITFYFSQYQYDMLLTAKIAGDKPLTDMVSKWLDNFLRDNAENGAKINSGGILINPPRVVNVQGVGDDANLVAIDIGPDANYAVTDAMSISDYIKNYKQAMVAYYIVTAEVSSKNCVSSETCVPPTATCGTWCPMLVVFFGVTNFSSATAKKIFCDTKLTLSPEYTTMSADDLHNNIKEYCGYHYEPPNYTSYAYANKFFILDDNQNCMCYNSEVAPSIASYPGNPAAMCFSINCSDGELKSYGLDSDINGACAKYCDNVWDWMNSTDPAQQPQNPAEIDHEKYNRICGKNYVPPAKKLINTNVLVYGIVVAILVSMLVFSAGKHKGISNFTLATLVIIVFAVMTYLSVNRAKYYVGMPSCLPPYPGKMICVNKEGKTIPNYFCDHILNCECVSDEDCGDSSCTCRTSTCRPKNGTRPSHTVSKKQMNIPLLILSIIIFILFSASLIYLHDDFHWKVKKSIFIPFVLIIAIIPFIIVMIKYSKPIKVEVFDAPCGCPDCPEGQTCLNGGCVKINSLCTSSGCIPSPCTLDGKSCFVDQATCQANCTLAGCAKGYPMGYCDPGTYCQQGKCTTESYFPKTDWYTWQVYFEPAMSVPYYVYYDEEGAIRYSTTEKTLFYIDGTKNTIAINNNCSPTDSCYITIKNMTDCTQGVEMVLGGEESALSFVLDSESIIRLGSDFSTYLTSTLKTTIIGLSCVVPMDNILYSKFVPVMNWSCSSTGCIQSNCIPDGVSCFADEKDCQQKCVLAPCSSQYPSGFCPVGYCQSNICIPGIFPTVSGWYTWKSLDNTIYIKYDKEGGVLYSGSSPDIYYIANETISTSDSKYLNISSLICPNTLSFQFGDASSATKFIMDSNNNLRAKYNINFYLALDPSSLITMAVMTCTGSTTPTIQVQTQFVPVPWLCSPDVGCVQSQCTVDNKTCFADESTCKTGCSVKDYCNYYSDPYKNKILADFAGGLMGGTVCNTDCTKGVSCQACYINNAKFSDAVIPIDGDLQCINCHENCSSPIQPEVDALAPLSEPPGVILFYHPNFSEGNDALDYIRYDASGAKCVTSDDCKRWGLLTTECVDCPERGGKTCGC